MTNMTDDMVIKQEINAMNRLIDWCLSDKKMGYLPQRIRQLITDWSKVSGDIILEKILMNTLKKMEITFQRRLEDAERNKMVGSRNVG